MVILIGGASHAGKTLLSQKMLEKYNYPYLSIDHLKMGLIRSGNTDLTPLDDDRLTEYLWPIIREIVKTAVENKQNLIIEGCYIPFDWKKDFDAAYQKEIRYVCIIMSESYIQTHFEDIKRHACAIEARLDDSTLSARELIAENTSNLAQCIANNCVYIWIDQAYELDWTWIEQEVMLC